MLRTEFQGIKGKIAVLIILAGMTMGLLCPSACDDFCNSILELNNGSYEFNAPDISGIHDFVPELSFSINNRICSAARNSTSTRLLTSGFYGVDPYVRSEALLLQTGSGSFFILTLLGVSIFSSIHIRFIHLKDGNK